MKEHEDGQGHTLRDVLIELLKAKKDMPDKVNLPENLQGVGLIASLGAIVFAVGTMELTSEVIEKELEAALGLLRNLSYKALLVLTLSLVAMHGPRIIHALAEEAERPAEDIANACFELVAVLEHWLGAPYTMPVGEES